MWNLVSHPVRQVQRPQHLQPVDLSVGITALAFLVRLAARAPALRRGVRAAPGAVAPRRRRPPLAQRLHAEVDGVDLYRGDGPRRRWFRLLGRRRPLRLQHRVQHAPLAEDLGAGVVVADEAVVVVVGGEGGGGGVGGLQQPGVHGRVRGEDEPRRWHERGRHQPLEDGESSRVAHVHRRIGIVRFRGTD